jgi:hypothetical protein
MTIQAAFKEELNLVNDLDVSFQSLELESDQLKVAKARSCFQRVLWNIIHYITFGCVSKNPKLDQVLDHLFNQLKKIDYTQKFSPNELDLLKTSCKKLKALSKKEAATLNTEKKSVLKRIENVSQSSIGKVLGKIAAQKDKLSYEDIILKDNPQLFEELISDVQEREFTGWIYVKKSSVSDDQWQKLSDLCNTNRLKGLQVYAVDFSQGVVPGFLHMNQTRYNEAKTFVAGEQVRWILTNSLKRYFPEGNVESVFDFGAGQSPEIQCMAKNNIGLKKIVAADFDGGELEKLKNALPASYQERLETFEGAFVKYQADTRFKLFMSSFTLPYRTPDQFEEVWNKLVSMTDSEGVMAFHLFGAPKNPHANLTYHKLAEIKKMLKKVACEFEILVEKPNGSLEFVFWSDGQEKTRKESQVVNFDIKHFKKTDVWGGEEPEWGTLFHIIAKKKAD